MYVCIGGKLLEADRTADSSVKRNKIISSNSPIKRLDIIGRDKIEQNSDSSIAIENEKPGKESIQSKIIWWIFYIIGGLLIAYLVFKFGWK